MTVPPLTWLYVPADRPERVEKAIGSRAHAVIVDLEDGVAPGEAAYDIARAPGVAGISFGEADLRSETGAGETGLDWARSRVVNAAVAAGLPRPPQSVYPILRETPVSRVRVPAGGSSDISAGWRSTRHSSSRSSRPTCRPSSSSSSSGLGRRSRGWSRTGHRRR